MLTINEDYVKLQWVIKEKFKWKRYHKRASMWMGQLGVINGN